MDDVCTWTRLPDSREFGDLRPIRFNIGCCNSTARGSYAFYPDVCPHCRCAVVIGSASVKDEKQ